MKKYGVWAIPPTFGLMSDLSPRFQIRLVNGVEEIVTYESKEEAEKWCKECSSCRITKWTYEVREIK